MRLIAARLNRGLSDELPKDRPEVSREIAGADVAAQLYLIWPNGFVEWFDLPS